MVDNVRMHRFAFFSFYLKADLAMLSFPFLRINGFFFPGRRSNLQLTFPKLRPNNDLPNGDPTNQM